MGALSGIRVIDLSIIVQGPQAGAMLHDLGADVVKVELPGMGDLARWIHIGPDDTRSGFFEACNRGKRSVALDLRTEGGRRAVRRLIEGADVVLSNFVPGTMDAWGLGYEELSELNPRLIYATGSALGPVGPDAGREGADTTGQAAGGLVSTTGRKGGEPSLVGAVITDHLGSQNLVIGILAALHHRANSGRGQRVDVSLLGGAIWAQASEYTYCLLTGQPAGQSDRGHPMIRGLLHLFATADGWLVMVGVPAHLWPGFARAIDRPELAEDPRFNTLFIQPEDLAELFTILDGIFVTRTTAEWCERLAAEQQRFAPVRNHAEVVADPQAWANGYFMEADHPEWGPIKVVGNPIRFSETPATPGVATPQLGEHTEEVLLEVGFTWEELDKLRADGAW